MNIYLKYDFLIFLFFIRALQTGAGQVSAFFWVPPRLPADLDQLSQMLALAALANAWLEMCDKQDIETKFAGGHPRRIHRLPRRRPSRPSTGAL